MLTERPIPGQSLTTESGSSPYERPPETSDPRVALKMHLDNLNKPQSIEDIAHFTKLDVDIDFSSAFLIVFSTR